MTYANHEEQSVYGVAYTGIINVSYINWGTSDQVMRTQTQGKDNNERNSSHFPFCVLYFFTHLVLKNH